MLGGVRRYLFGISHRETDFARRGFCAACDQARQRLETCGRAFVTGYNTGLRFDDPAALAQRLGDVPGELQGFAFEGAAMALALLDTLSPWRSRRWRTFCDGAGDRHAYMVHVGAGWALARLRRDPLRRLADLDPLLRWLVVDGYGFHQGYFHPDRYLDGQPAPANLQGYAPRAFDQGLARCLWFSHGADVRAIASAVEQFEQSRQSDLYSGIGLACTYAGGVEVSGIEMLRDGAAQFATHLAQGAAFAAKARQRAGNITAHTELACRLLCDSTADDAARVTDEVLVGLTDADSPSSFERWRRRIQQRYTEKLVEAVAV